MTDFDLSYGVIAAACVGSYFLGWALGALWYVFRRFAWQATN